MMRRIPRRRASGVLGLVGVVVGLALTASCTSSTWDTSKIDDTTPTTAVRYPDTAAGYTASLTHTLSHVGVDLGEWAAPEKEAKCAASRIVDRLTVDRLKALGYDRQDGSLALGWSDDERSTVINILTSCIDFSAAILESVSSYLKLGLEPTNCMAKGYERLGLTRDLAASLVDGKEPDPFADGDRFGSGVAQLATECMGENDLIPDTPMPRLPEATGGPSVSTTTSTIPDDGQLNGIEPGSPLDVTTTIP